MYIDRRAIDLWRNSQKDGDNGDDDEKQRRMVDMVWKGEGGVGIPLPP